VQSIAVIMLCLAPSGLSASAYVWYFAFFYFLYYSVGWSMTVITYDALAMELTTDYDERSSLFGAPSAPAARLCGTHLLTRRLWVRVGYKGMSQMIGYILYFAAAGVFAATYPNDVHKQIIVPGIVFTVIVLLAFAQMLVVVDEPPQSEAQIKAAQEADDGVVPMVRRMLRNPVYWNYLWFKAPGSMGKLATAPPAPRLRDRFSEEQHNILRAAARLTSMGPCARSLRGPRLDPGLLHPVRNI
jgi:Na+/melibiose symporter-like transporter